MFNRILIANRGEIACRIIKTARRMGVETVAVFSDADETAMHVQMADRAVRIGPAPASESYLLGDRIIRVALETGAQAVHPGYGFLSENADFAEAVEVAGLTFIGPSAQAIRDMGLKGRAKALMEKASVPVVPGYHGDDQSDDLLAKQAGRIGFPVLIKAVAGGGGKGMRRVNDFSEFGPALSSARNEARAAFGNDRVLIEKLIERPRHIEVQIFGDGERAVHLFERDCSLQRRHQKVIEEAPAPDMPDDVRAAMTDAAVRAAEAIGYKGAGTVEFIADAGEGGLRADGYWFMEMNTRLQVEHPVTETVTGVDLVEWQLRVAAGEPLPLAQDAIELSGHAVEARVYAEDVPAGFLPATGRIEALGFPNEVRADTGVQTGDEISTHYDPMIAKVVAAGTDRAAALARLTRALDQTRTAGTTTNLGFLSRLLRDPAFADGAVHTGLIEAADGLTDDPEPSEPVVAVVTAALARTTVEHAGFALWQRFEPTVNFSIARTDFCVRVATLGNDTFEVVSGSSRHLVVLGDETARVDGRSDPFWSHRFGDELTVLFQGRWKATVSDPLDRGTGGLSGGDNVVAPMPGLVTKIDVSVGDEVVEGQSLGAMEAMKMEMILRAPRAGKIAGVQVIEGTQVSAGASIVNLEPEDG